MIILILWCVFFFFLSTSVYIEILSGSNGTKFLHAKAENMLFQRGCVIPMETVLTIIDPNYVRRLSVFVQRITLPLK